MSQEIKQAMLSQTAFSWVENRKVQSGVYLEIPQLVFAAMKVK